MYTGIYEFRDNRLETLLPQTVTDIREITERLCKLNREVIFLGDGVPVYREALTERLMAGQRFSFAPAHLNKQRAGAVAVLALRYLREGKSETAAEHRPEYLRLPQAERERAEKERAKQENGKDGPS